MLTLLLVFACAGPETLMDTDVSDTDTVVASDETNRDGVCTFNRECPSDQRCDCVDGLCGCANGARGTGRNGIDTCVDGADCASSLCVEGDSAFYCSDECEDETGCAAGLPECIDVAFIGRICTR